MLGLMCLPAAWLLFACAPQTPPGAVPLAFVRRIVVAPVALVTPPDVPLSPAPSLENKRARSDWEGRRKARTAFLQLRSQALGLFREAVSAELTRTVGLIVADEPAAPSPPFSIRAHATSLPYALASVAEWARSSQSDAALAPLVDRFGLNTGLERELWVRVAGNVVMAADGEVRGPYFAIGTARSARKMFGFGKGFDRTDEELMRAAVTQAAHRLARALTTGVEMPFARNSRVAILPAFVPERITKTLAGTEAAGDATVTVSVPGLRRQRDVLFQPEVGPAAEMLDSDDVLAALRSARISPEVWWESDAEMTARAQAIAESLQADYVFMSRVTRVEMEQSEAEVRDGDRPARGISRHVDVEAEGALYSAAARRVVWRDRAEGGTIAVTEFVRHQPRIRTDEQCVLDAARTAYAHLRSGFDSYLRRFDR